VAVQRTGTKVTIVPLQAADGRSDSNNTRVMLSPGATKRRNEVRVALLPSVSELRFVSSPALVSAALAMSSRPVTRTVIRARMAGRRMFRDRDRARCIAECDATALDHLIRLAAGAGLRIESVTHSDFSWASAATDAAGRDAVCAIQVLDGEAHVRLLYVKSGEPAALRRLPIHADAKTISDAIRALNERFATDTGQQPIPLLPLGDASFRQRMNEAVEIAGCRCLGPNGIIADVGHDPAAVAAAFAGFGPRFVPPGVVAAATRRNRRRGLCAAMAAAVLLAIAGVLDAVDLRREISAVRAERAVIAADVADAMRAREDVDLLAITVSQVEGSRRAAPGWTALLTTLSERIPSTSRVTALRAVGDSLYLELEGGDAAAAFEGLRGISWLSGFRAVAPIQREMGGDSQITERFSAVALVSWSELNGNGAGAQ